MTPKDYSLKPRKRHKNFMDSAASGPYKRRLKELRENIRSTLGLRAGGVDFIGPLGAYVGESHQAARHTDNEVLQCIDLRLAGFSLNEISAKMEIPKRTVRDFFAGRIRGKHPVKFVKATINK